MAVETGLNWLVAVDDAENEAIPTWKDLPQQTTGTLTFSKSDVDATNKDNSGWEDFVTTRRGWALSVEGQYDDANNAATFALFYLIDTNALHATDVDAPVHLRLTNAAGDTLIGWSTMESFEYSYDEQGLVTYSGSFKGRSRTNTGASSPLAQTLA